ncbi:hypothetical protein HG566_00380 [Helicobacter pylori]|uniref:hypothetical protein n=1 Tax=Helicobacter pylori TaxID=210 RepID=UPI001924E07B|nr:hypothetical protein [Helicobacter pylori]QQW87359.1 hypothetical protein HG566_00380 [Helicobacter pylori]
MEALALFWGENLKKHARVFGRSGWFKKCLSVLSLLSYRLMVKILFKLALGMSD